MRIRDLGPLEVEVNSHVVPVVGQRLASLLILLTHHLNEVVSADALIEAVWPQQPPAKGDASLESLVWRLRRVLEPDRPPRQAATVLRTEEGGYRLIVDRTDVDSARFADEVRIVRQLVADGDHRAAAARATTAESLWRGQPFTGMVQAEWMSAAREGLANLRFDMAELQVEALLEIGQPEQAVALLEPLLVEQPFRERFWKQRMLGLYRAGRQAAALEAFRQVQTLLADELGVDPGAELQDLHRRILEHHADLERLPSAVPGSTSARYTGEPQLPARTLSLIGRTDELSSLQAMIEHSALITLTGPGGVGKTRLAVELAHAVRPSFRDGAYFADLTAIHESESLPLLVAQLLSLKVEPNATVGDTILNWAAARQFLLVLDNCEHVLPAAAALVAGLVIRCPAVRVIATSREPLEVPAEQRWAVTPLTLPGPESGAAAASTAVQMLADRLGRPLTDVDLEGDDEVALGRICTAVAGLPLGIELAAGHARNFQLSEIADALSSSPVQLMRLGGGPPRQATLHDTVEWSYRLLTADEQALHRRLSCISGGVTLEAAGALCQVAPLVPEQAMGLLSGLAHRSLLVTTHPTEQGRPTAFTQLVPIRAHADRALAEPVERTAVERARDDWVFERVRQSPYDGRPGQAEFYDWLDANQAPVRATLLSMLIKNPDRRGIELTVLLSQYWFDRNRLIEGDRWARAAASVDQSIEVDDLDRVMGQIVLGCMLALGSDPAAARDIFTGNVGRLADVSPSRSDVVGQLLVLVSLSAFLGLQWDIGWDAACIAIELAQTSGDDHLLLRARALRAASALWHRGPEAAVVEADAVLAALELSPNAHAELNAAVARSAAARWTADGAAGVYWTGRAVRANRTMGAVNMADLGELLAAHLLNAQRPDDAVRCFAASAAVHSRSGLAASRRVATAASMTALRSLVPANVFEQLWASGDALGRAEPEHFIDTWLTPPDAPQPTPREAHRF